LLACAAGAAAALVVFVGRRHSPQRLWAVCGTATFLVLLAGTHLLQPAYARKFSLRGEVRPQAALGADPSVPVVCYPRRWDSVSFYLKRDDVRVFTPGQSAELFALLREQPRTVVVVKSGRELDRLLEEMPPSLEFEPHGRQGAVTVGLVRPRQAVPDSVWASVP
jgi:hypothetical protein